MSNTGIIKDLWKALYDLEPWVTLFAGIVISIILWICIRPKRLQSLQMLAFSICFVIILSALGVCYYSKQVYTYVPEIFVREEPLSRVRAKLEQAGLICLDRDITADLIAQKHLDDGEDINDNAFKVVTMSYTSGAFVKKGTLINVSVTWADNLHTPSMSWQDDSEFDPVKYYSGIDPDTLYGCNADEIDILTGYAGCKIYTDDQVERHLNVYPPYEDHIIVEAELIEYDTQRIVEKKVAYLGETITFTVFPDGVYYYVAYSSGYKLVSAPTLIKIERNESMDKEYSLWEAYLEKNGAAFSDSFKIRLELLNGRVPDPVNMVLRVKNPMDLFPSREGMYTFATDEEGYLTLDGHMAEFSLFDNCILQLEPENGNGEKLYDVKIEDGVGICTITP